MECVRPEPQKPPRERIAVFAQLENPKTQDATPQQLGDFLDKNKAEGFVALSPDEVRGDLVEVWFGDSRYGVRMGVVKRMLAQALYSPDEFEGYVRDASNKEAQIAREMESKSGTQTPPPKSKMERATRAIKRKFGTREQQSGEDLARAEERQEINIQRHKTHSVAYQSLVGIVHQIGEQYKRQGLTVEDIFRLTEAGHYFSGKWNGSGRNLTFTDSIMREYGVQLQQVVERVWQGGLFDDQLEDPSKPLSEEELFPERYPGR